MAWRHLFQIRKNSNIGIEKHKILKSTQNEDIRWRIGNWPGESELERVKNILRTSVGHTCISRKSKAAALWHQSMELVRTSTISHMINVENQYGIQGKEMEKQVCQKFV